MPASANSSTAGGLAAILLWSTTFAFARSLSEQAGALSAAAATYLLGGSICLARVLTSRRLLRDILSLSPAYLFGCGGLFAFYTAAIYLAVGLSRDREQLLEIALVNYLWPALTVVFSIPILGQRGRIWLLPGTGLALLGVFLVMTQGAQVSWAGWFHHLHSNPIAYLAAFAASVSWALYSNLTRRWCASGARGAVELFLPVTGVVLLALRALTGEHGQWTARAAGEMVALAMVTLLSYFLWDLAMRRGNILLVAACSYFTPLLSTVVSCIYLAVNPGRRVWIGALLVVLGSLITWKAGLAREQQRNGSA